jgi:Holliday junction DNA helicase RuvB
VVYWQGENVAKPAPRFHEFIGHRNVVDRLCRLMDGARARKEPFPHTLFAGPSGVGKSKLARTLAEEYGTKCVKVMGHKDAKDLGVALAALETNSFLFIEEAHRLGAAEQEFLCEAIDEKSIPITDPKDDKKKVPEPIKLEPFSLIVATDQPGRFLDAFINRLVIHIDLDFYPIPEMKEIVEGLAGKTVLISPQAAKALAEAAGGLPRCAEQLLKKLRLFFPDSEKRELRLDDIRKFLKGEGIDDSGLSPLQQRYLAQLSECKVAALESLALALGTDAVYLRRHVEARLIRRGMVKITSGGRQLTAEGLDWIGIRKPVTILEKKEKGHVDDQGRSAAA